jgi:hypothetical protein
MRSGRDTLASIEEALTELKVQESRLQSELEHATRERGEIAARRLEALRGLATIRAHDAMADGLVDEADNLSRDMRTILQARLKTIAQLNRRRDEADAERDELVRSLDALNTQIAALEEKLDRFAAHARTALREDAGYKSLSEEHVAVSAMLDKATAKAEQVARDENEKGRPYRSDPLFMYLWNRKFATSAYQATGLVRVLDQWVAGLIGYADARANYAMLTEIPIRLRTHAQQLGKAASEAKTKLDEIEKIKTEELAGSTLIAELKQAREEQSDQNKKLTTVTAELTETGNQLRLYANGEDQSLRDAIQGYAVFLEKENLQRLMSDAFATKTRDDDVLVERLRNLGSELGLLENQNEQRRQSLDAIVEKRRELMRLSANFRREHYEDTGSAFSENPDLEELLQLLLRGAISAAEYWARARAQQQWQDRAGDPWRRQSGLPPFDPWPGGRAGGTWTDNRPTSTGRGSGPDVDFETGGRI